MPYFITSVMDIGVYASDILGYLSSLLAAFTLSLLVGTPIGLETIFAAALGFFGRA